MTGGELLDRGAPAPPAGQACAARARRRRGQTRRRAEDDPRVDGARARRPLRPQSGGVGRRGVPRSRVGLSARVGARAAPGSADGPHRRRDLVGPRARAAGRRSRAARSRTSSVSPTPTGGASSSAGGRRREAPADDAAGRPRPQRPVRCGDRLGRRRPGRSRRARHSTWWSSAQGRRGSPRPSTAHPRACACWSSTPAGSAARRGRAR